MMLSAERIREILVSPPEQLCDRLIISPILDINRQLKPGTASVDIRLGRRFVVPLRTKLSKLDRLSDEHQKDLQRYKDEIFVPIGDHFVLHPRQFVLGETIEWIHLPRNLSAFVIGRSTWGRDGLIIATATGVHPRFSGVLTLELSNIGEIPIYLYPGCLIAQLFIETLEPGVSTSSQVPSVFHLQASPGQRNVEMEDADVIKIFRERLSM